MLFNQFFYCFAPTFNFFPQNDLHQENRAKVLWPQCFVVTYLLLFVWTSDTLFHDCGIEISFFRLTLSHLFSCTMFALENPIWFVIKPWLKVCMGMINLDGGSWEHHITFKNKVLWFISTGQVILLKSQFHIFMQILHSDFHFFLLSLLWVFHLESW